MVELSGGRSGVHGLVSHGIDNWVFVLPAIIVLSTAGKIQLSVLLSLVITGVFCSLLSRQSSYLV